MKRRYLGQKLAILALVVSMGTSASLAAALGTAFTYQGRLTSANAPANGHYDFVFRLFDAVSGGSQVGADLPLGNVQVTTGLFTVQLDFGQTPFTGNARWLEIGVRPTGGGSYTTLTPRQPLTATPFALYALNGGLWQQVGNAITNTNSGFVGVNRSSTVSGSEYFGIYAPVSNGSYGGMYVSTDPNGWPFYGYSSGGGLNNAAWTYLDGVTSTWYLNNGGNRLAVQSDGDVGIGTTTPGARLEVVAGASENGIKASTSAATSFGVYGIGTSGGVYGQSSASDGTGVYGRDDTTGASGVEGHHSGNGGAGVAGYDSLGTGVYGQSDSGWAVYGSCPGGPGYAGYFNGNAHVQGTLSKAGGSFKIDHPLDPAHKYLSHSFVESPDMMNIYNGVVTLDAQGTAVVTLPDWFEALNRDFRYQLTAIGAPGPNLYIAREVENNQFAIAGGQAGQKVSWQVTGVRHDVWADAHRIPVEQVKPAGEQGRYMAPELFGADASLQIGRSHELDARAAVDRERAAAQ